MNLNHRRHVTRGTYLGRRSRSGRVDTSAIAPLVLATILSVVAMVALVGRGVSPKIVEETDAVTVSAWTYEQRIAYSEIDSVTLRSGLSGLRRRLNGFQSGNTYLGFFEMVPFGRVSLFVNALHQPFVQLYAKDRVVILSASDSAAATALALRLQHASSRAQQR